MNRPGDQSSERQDTILQRIKNILGLILVALLIVVLLQLVTLSRNRVEDSRRMLNELTNQLRETQKENEHLKKELGNTKAKVEIIPGKFPRAQKVSARVRRTTPVQRERDQRNISSRKCVSEPTDYIHVRRLGPGPMLEHWRNIADRGSLKIAWSNDYFVNTDNKNNDSVVLKDPIHIKIRRTGTYFVYCNLRVKTKFIKDVSVMSHHQGKDGHEKLFCSSIPFHNNTDTYEVRLFGLVPISKGTQLCVRVKYKGNSWDFPRNATSFLKLIHGLFPDPNGNNNNFGVFSVK